MKGMKTIYLEPGTGVLHCMKCGSPNLHHRIVDVFNRESEDMPGIRVRVDHLHIDSGGAGDQDFIGRRDDVRFQFWCENCEKISTLVLYQHKGCTYLLWWEGEVPEIKSGQPPEQRT